MGTYTTNYNLFLPSIGEQGWGDLVNGNFSTIDTTMTGLNTRIGTAETNITSLTTRMGTAETTISSNKSRIGTLETETDIVADKVDGFDSRISALETGIKGDINCDSVTANRFKGYIVSDYILTQNPTVQVSYLSLSLPSGSCASSNSASTTVWTINQPFKDKIFGLGVVGGDCKGGSLTFTFSADNTAGGSWQSRYSRAHLIFNGETIATVADDHAGTYTVDLVEGENVLGLSVTSAYGVTITATVSAITAYAEQYIP